MLRIAHYVASTHWDREWYEPFQGFRMRLVSLLNEVWEILDRDPDFQSFVMDGQVIPLLDYLEIHPERREQVERFVREGSLKLGPWYVLPDEWLVSGESLVRNLQYGMRMAEEFGAPSSRAGFVCDMFGHTGQLPQIFSQMGIPFAFLWRGTHEREHAGLFRWEAPDGAAVPAYRFGKDGYCSYAFAVRDPLNLESRFDQEIAIPNLVEYVLREAERTPDGPLLLFDGADHLEIEPSTPALLAIVNELLFVYDIEIVQSNLDRYMEDALRSGPAIRSTLTGELRETGRDPVAEDQQWLIPGVLSSRIRLKQQNAACEDELCLWAEPFSAFAAELGQEYPEGFLRAAWKHLMENHPHDSICGCSIDEVHRDMVFRFDQSLDISSRLTANALSAITLAAAPSERPEGALVIGVFNPTARDVDEPVDLDIPLPENWPVFQEFFGFEQKFSFRLRGPEGDEIPYQILSQRPNRKGFLRPRYKFPVADTRTIVRVTAQVHVPAFGISTLLVEPGAGPVRYPGSLAVSGNTIENEFLRLEVSRNGSITLTDTRSGRQFKRLLTFEERADIGDGWYHGVAVNDCIYTSDSSGADVALVSDGPEMATLRVTITLHVPEEFDFQRMVRSERLTPLVIVSDLTLRRGCARVEVSTTVKNTVSDHRVRVLFPTGLAGDSYWSDSAFDAVERPLALAPDNALRRELDVETRPQQTWTAFGDGHSGLAVVSRGLPESAVLNRPDRAIALTLFRGFRRAVFANDNPGGQSLGDLAFRFHIIPFAGDIPTADLFLQGQRIHGAVRISVPSAYDFDVEETIERQPRSLSFLRVEGGAVVTSIQRREGALLVRLFNPGLSIERISLHPIWRVKKAACVTLEGIVDTVSAAVVREGSAEVTIPPKRIATVVLE